MYKHVVKITQYKGQTRVTIPKVIAKETGIDKAVIVIMESMKDKSIKIKEYHGKDVKKRDLQKNKTGPDR